MHNLPSSFSQRQRGGVDWKSALGPTFSLSNTLEDLFFSATSVSLQIALDSLRSAGLTDLTRSPTPMLRLRQTAWLYSDVALSRLRASRALWRSERPVKSRAPIQSQRIRPRIIQKARRLRLTIVSQGRAPSTIKTLFLFVSPGQPPL